MTITVTRCGRLCFGRRKINLKGVVAGQNVGVREVANHVWLISFMHYDLGFFDDTCNRVECAPNPFSAKVSSMSPYMDAPRCTSAPALGLQERLQPYIRPLSAV